MASINVSGAFKTKNDVLLKLLHKGNPIGLRFWGPTSSAVGGREEIIVITSGWYHKQSKNAETGAVSEVVKVNESEVMTESVVKRVSGFDILYSAAAGDFERFEIVGKSQLKPISHEWTWTVKPLKGDKKDLYVAPPPGP